MTAEQRADVPGHAAGGRGRPGGATRRTAGRAAQDASPSPRHRLAARAARRCPIICVASSTTTSPRTRPARQPDCGQPMTRVGEDISERLDIVPAEFFVHRHIYGKWTCRCCQRQGIERLVQEPADPQIIDGGIAASGLVAHTLISRFVDHLPYYRQEAINARSGVHTPRSTLAAQRRQRRRSDGAAVRGAQALRAELPGAACRRDAGGDAGPRRGQDQAGVHLGLRARRARCPARGDLRVLPGPRVAVPGGLPGCGAGSAGLTAGRPAGVERHAGVRPVRGLRRRARQARVPAAHRRPLRCACPAQVR